MSFLDLGNGWCFAEVRPACKGLEDVASFETRRSTFTRKLQKEVGGVYWFFQPLNRDIYERQMLVILIQVDNKAAVINHFMSPKTTILHPALKERSDVNFFLKNS